MKNLLFICLMCVCGLITTTSVAQEDPLVVIFNSIPTPIETGYLVRDIGSQYDAAMLNPAGKSGGYSSEYQKALNLGIYSADLGYASIFSQPVTTLGPYLTDIKKLADDLGIGGHINIGTITSTALTGKLEKLMMETSIIFSDMSEDLQVKNRTDLAALMLIGGWLEALYIACSTVEKTPNEMLSNRIAEQLLVSTMLIDEFGDAKYSSNPNIQEVRTTLQRIHDGLGKLATVEKSKDGISISSVNITEDALKDVISFVRLTRKSIIN